MTPRRFTHILAWTGVVAWSAVIFSMSALPGSSVPGRFGTLAHFAEYAILGALLLFALGTRHPLTAAAILAIAIASAYGVTDELHQAFVPMRMPDPIDWLVDTAGACMGAAVATTFVIARRPREDQ